MKYVFLTIAAIVFSNAAAFATTNDCKKSGANWKCNVNGDTYTVANASSEAEAAAFAASYAAQQQSQTATGGGGGAGGAASNEVNFSSPKNTTSFNVGVGLNIRLGEGVQANSAREAADWLAKHGQSCIALDVILHSPQVRKLGYDVDCSVSK